MAVSDDERARFGYALLLALLVVAIGLTLALSARPMGIVLAVVVQAAAVSVALEVTRATRRVRLVANVALVAVVLALAIVTSPLTPASPELSLLLSRSVGLGLALVIPVRIARRAVASRRITLDTVAAGLCVYLLLGLAFGYVHLLVDAAAAGAYSKLLTDADAVYLSFVTLTTVGFGDVVPVSGPARAVTIVESVLGQLYLVSVIAVLVGNIGREKTR